ncbi:TPA: hypothetical protein ACT9LS_003087 [Legionella pneumophila]|uniref:hypothetical protein n=1 Tax=Legionella pneumophila TaxID=446 RepID=UPI0001E3C7EA|nr:hypothetical protein [Legionella pneumophila]HAT9040180.1 hypothetical protein [Legionella pneumophila subsp. pneumophila]TIE29291.1 hypothetical protein DIZ48_03445 [Legionella pneumophila]TIE50796.1 hypothetical protein DIZ50_03445 [Legionella pneumophila]WBV72394.1 hypothetical protein PGH42_05340 [Legionella pneumophila]BCZ97765.1 hypothetical protein LEG80045_20210 [Legionella pneumophila]
MSYSLIYKPKEDKTSESLKSSTASPTKPEPQVPTHPLYEKLEHFWQNYPAPAYKKSAWEQFEIIAPDETLLFRLYSNKK